MHNITIRVFRPSPRRRTPALVLTVLGLVAITLGAACSSSDSVRSPSPSSSLATSPAANSTQTPGLTPSSQTSSPVADFAVTLNDDGKTIDLRQSQRFLLALGEGRNWTVTVADARIVSRVVNTIGVRGEQGVYQAGDRGQTVLSAIGDPQCRGATPPCGAPSRLFRVTLTVR